MRKENVIVAFMSQKTSQNIVRLLSNSGFTSITVCQSGAEVKKTALSMESGIIVCGYRFSDMTIISLADDIPEEFSILLIGNKGQVDMCEHDRVFKISVPLKREDLVEAMEMLSSMHSRSGINSAYYFQLPTEEEKRKAIIDEAKLLLITRYSMTEEQAHRYIQKKSMDTGTKMVDIAKLIIE